MATIYDVDVSELIEKAAEELKKIKELEPPAWAAYAKTGRHRERPPVKQDWWYTRAASILRYIYRSGPIGVSKLRTRYGGKRRMGVVSPHFHKGSGNIIRKILQKLEKAGFLKQAEKGGHKGRVITPQGISFLDKIAGQFAVKPKREAAEEKKESKEQLKEKKEKSDVPVKIKEPKKKKKGQGAAKQENG